MRLLIKRLSSAWERHGAVAFFQAALKTIIALPRRMVVREKDQVSQLDRNLGIETDRVLWVGELGVDPRSESSKHANWYAPTEVAVFERALASVTFDARQFTFVDYGSGKGRALILAARMPFKQIVGVEFSESLHAIALDNIARAAEHASLACRDIRSICADATTLVPPDGPLICYLYNPFGAVVIEKVLSRLVDSLQSNPRPAFIVYVNPVHRNAVTRTSAFCALVETPDFCVYEYAHVQDVASA
jgi:SAM-dependent methyltransferase